jgi:DNA/RNA endonuclease G (NUC1)/PKD repeat protein
MSIMRRIRKSFALAISAAALLLPVFQASAIIDATLQMQLGNPTGATADPSNHVHYLIQRTVEAIDYSDTNGCPNWASWDLTASDVGTATRSSEFFPDTTLPPGFRNIGTGTFGTVGGTSYDRGHMCDSEDRTDNDTDNNLVFLMSNIIVQDAKNNEGLWGAFETYCRTLLTTQELLITCGPYNFSPAFAGTSHVYIPSNIFKVVVCAPLGTGTAFDRITNANPASIRVIAIETPNDDSVSGHQWQNYITSAKQVQQDTGYNFFSALPNNLAWVLRSKVDGQAAAVPSFGSFSPSSGSQGNSILLNGTALDTITNVSFNGTSASYTITATNQIIALVPAGASSGQIIVRGLGGSATNISSFTVTPPVIANFTLTPSTAFTSSGDQGGPFSPSSQIYTLNNTNATSLSWAVGKNVPWLDLSASSGTLLAGASTDITVSVNGAANSLIGGVYSGTVTFSNSATGAWVPRSVSLTVLTSGQLDVSPVNTYSVMETVGGPFSPSSQDYVLSNTGSVSVNWTAGVTASWLNLSAASGTLAGGSSTVVTVSINGNVVGLALGNYSDVIGFTNTTNDAGDTTRAVALNVISFGFYDDFSTFNPGNLIGQAGWQEQSTTNDLWSFESGNTSAFDGITATTVGNIAADVGSGIATGVHASASTAWTAAVGDGSANSWNANHWAVGDYFQFQVSTLGIAGVQLGWDQTSSATGPRDFVLKYSTNGTTFTQFGGTFTILSNATVGGRVSWQSTTYDPAYHSSVDLSSVTALNNQSTVYFRLVDNSTTSVSGGTVGSTGTDRVDNFLVSRVSVTPIQISGGVAGIPGGNTNIKPDASKDFLSTTNLTVFAGMVVTITNAAPANTGTPSFFAALATANGGVGNGAVADYQLTAAAADAGNTNYVFGGRTTGESGAPFVYGAAGLTYGSSYRVIIQTDPAGSNMTLYVNPTSNVLGAQTPYLTAVGGAGITPATILGSIVMTQSKNGSLPTVGAEIGKVSVASDYVSVYTFLLGNIPPVADFIGSPTSGTAPLTVTFNDNSTGGTISNWFWDFGDSNTTNVTTNSVMHTYAAGTYTVTLIASGPGGVSTNTKPGYITVLTPFQAWQVMYFGSTTNPAAAANADPDGDGQDNMAEFLAGTDPTSAASALRITSISKQGADVLVNWMTAVGKTNALQATSGDLSGSYNTNGFADIVIITNTIGTVTNAVDAGGATNVPSRFYRVRLVP